MKRWISLLIIFALSLSLFGCGKEEQPAAPEKVPAADVQVQEAEAESPEATWETEAYVPVEVIFDSGALTFSFENGDTVALDYDEANVEIDGNEYNFVFYFKDYSIPVEVHCFLQDDYMQLEPYVRDLIAWDDWSYPLETFPVTYAEVSGLELQSVFNGFDENLFIIPLGHSNAIFGYVHFSDSEGHPELDPLTIWQKILKAGPASNGSAGSGYAYEAPIFLGDTVESMTYQLDDGFYRFPTPAQELIRYGWEIPEFFITETPQIPPREYVEAAFKQGSKTIWNVVLYNPSDSPIDIEQGIVSNMLIADNSDVDLLLPEVISLVCPEDRIAESTSKLVYNGNYATYSWYDEQTDSIISAWIPSGESTPEYFEFNTMF